MKKSYVILSLLLLLFAGCGSTPDKISEFKTPFQESNQVSVKTNSIVVNETLNEKQNINDYITNNERIGLKTFTNDTQYHFVTNMYDLLDILQFPISKITSDKSNNLKNSYYNKVIS